MKKTNNGTPIVNQEQLVELLKKSPKGICTLGDVGRGKTWAFEQVFERKFDMFSPEGSRFLSANDVSAIYAAKGMEGLQKVFTYQLQGRAPLIIDDIGTEMVMGHYGSNLDAVQWLILQCYAKKIPMYFTTNLTLDALTERYGKRVVDRIKESTYIIVLEGKNHREETYKNTEAELDTLL